VKGIFLARVSDTNTNKENGEEEKGRVPCDKKYIFHFEFTCNTKSVNRFPFKISPPPFYSVILSETTEKTLFF